MDARFFLNRIKEETRIKTDKELAEAMGVKYGTLTKWVARNSIPKDPLIEFVVKHGIDLKQLIYDDMEETIKQQFSGSSVPRLTISAIDSLLEDEAQVFAEQLKETYSFVAQYGNRVLLKKFEEEFTALSASYIEKCEKLKDMLEN